MGMVLWYKKLMAARSISQTQFVKMKPYLGEISKWKTTKSTNVDPMNLMVSLLSLFVFGDLTFL